MSTSFATRLDRVLDLVGDVRDDLHGAPEVVAAPLLLDHRQVDLAGRPVVVARRHLVGEALVVPEVEVGLRAVVGDVDLAVLVRAHRPRVDVDVGVELLERDLVAVALEQRADRGRRQALAERGNHAAGDEDVLDGPLLGLWHLHAVSQVATRGREQRAARARDLRGVSTPMRVVSGFDGLDADAVLERAQLLERLGALHRGLRQRGQAQQRGAAVDVEADVRPGRRRAAARAA